MRPRLAEPDQMTIDEFLAFAAERPDNERWELVEGQPVVNAPPTDLHQIIVANIIGELIALNTRLGASWICLPGVGTRVPVSPRSLPQPDAMVKATAGIGKQVSDEALVLFEVLSPSNRPSDQAWRRKVYTSIPNLQHYVTVSQSRVAVVRADRANGWMPTRIEAIDAPLELLAVGGELAMSIIYRNTPHAI